MFVIVVSLSCVGVYIFGDGSEMLLWRNIKPTESNEKRRASREKIGSLNLVESLICQKYRRPSPCYSHSPIRKVKGKKFSPGVGGFPLDWLVGRETGAIESAFYVLNDDLAW